MRKLKNSIPCGVCGDLFVPGGALVSHERSCDPNKKRRRRSNYREVFFAKNGVGPYDCYFSCGELLEFSYVVVHHIDGDHTNDSQENLAPTHRSCHNGYHFKELWKENKELLIHAQEGAHRSPHSEETKKALSDGHKKKGLQPTKEAIEKARIVNTNSKRNAVVREKLSSYAKNRTKEHQDKLNIALGKRVVSDETRHRMSQSAKARSDRKRSVGGDAR